MWTFACDVLAVGTLKPQAEALGDAVKFSRLLMTMVQVAALLHVSAQEAEACHSQA